jgi:bifunctional DNA-binding transcriptional regulator/antitoxin component of YhaV-PrlF toxin-antitoxin module
MSKKKLELKASLFGRIARQIAMLSLNENTSLEEAYDIYLENLTKRMKKYQKEIEKTETRRNLLVVARQKRGDLEGKDIYSDLRNTVALGRSLAITIPDTITKKLGIGKGDKLYITLKDSSIVIKPLPIED